VTLPARPLWPPEPGLSRSGWWPQPVIYQVHPPSFAAPGLPGVSALRGVTAATPYLAGLGVDAIWLSPFDPSALTDDGSGDPAGTRRGAPAGASLGTLADFDELDSALHAHGIKVIADLAPDGASFDLPCGLSFDFELLEAGWGSGPFLQAVTDRLRTLPRSGPPVTWVLSGQDASPGRIRAAVLLMLALPGSVLLSQGEELGLREVTGIRSSGRAQEHDPGSLLNLYRQALAWRRKLQAAPSLEWMPGTSGQVLHLRRPGGWRSVTNFGPHAVPLPSGTVVAASGPLPGGHPDHGPLPADTTAWILTS